MSADVSADRLTEPHSGSSTQGQAMAEIDACWDELLSVVGKGGVDAGVAWVRRRQACASRNVSHPSRPPVAASRWLPPPATLLHRLLRRQVALLPSMPLAPGQGSTTVGAVYGEEPLASVTGIPSAPAALDSPTRFECLRVPHQLDVLLLLRALHRTFPPRDVWQFVQSLLAPPCALNRWVEAAARDLKDEFAVLEQLGAGAVVPQGVGEDDGPDTVALADARMAGGANHDAIVTDAMVDDIIPAWLRARTRTRTVQVAGANTSTLAAAANASRSIDATACAATLDAAIAGSAVAATGVGVSTAVALGGRESPASLPSGNTVRAGACADVAGAAHERPGSLGEDGIKSIASCDAHATHWQATAGVGSGGDDVGAAGQGLCSPKGHVGNAPATAGLLEEAGPASSRERAAALPVNARHKARQAAPPVNARHKNTMQAALPVEVKDGRDPWSATGTVIGGGAASLNWPRMAADYAVVTGLVALFGSRSRPRVNPLSTTLVDHSRAHGSPAHGATGDNAAGHTWGGMSVTPSVTPVAPAYALDCPLAWDEPGLWDDGDSASSSTGTSDERKDEVGDADTGAGASSEVGSGGVRAGAGALAACGEDVVQLPHMRPMVVAQPSTRMASASAQCGGGDGVAGGGGGEGGAATGQPQPGGRADGELEASRGAERVDAMDVEGKGGLRHGQGDGGIVADATSSAAAKGERKRKAEDRGGVDRQAARPGPPWRDVTPKDATSAQSLPVDKVGVANAGIATHSAPAYPAAWTALRDALHALLPAHVMGSAALPSDVDLLVSLPAPQQRSLLSLCNLGRLDDTLAQRLCQRLLLERADVGYLASITFLSSALLPRLRALGGEAADASGAVSSGSVSRPFVATLLAVGQKHPEALVEAVLGPTVLFPSNAVACTAASGEVASAPPGQSGGANGGGGGLSVVQCDLLVRCVRNGFPLQAAGNLLRFILAASLRGRGTLDVVSLSLSQGQGQGQGQEQGPPLLWSEPVVTLVQALVDEVLDVSYFQGQGELLGHLMAALEEVVLQPQVPPMLKFGNFLLKVVSRLGPLMAPGHRSVMERVLTSTTTFIKKTAMKKLAAL
eukprot:jgi/Mesvir1/8390/Mv12635-RA.1